MVRWTRARRSRDTPAPKTSLLPRAFAVAFVIACALIASSTRSPVVNFLMVRWVHGFQSGFWRRNVGERERRGGMTAGQGVREVGRERGRCGVSVSRPLAAPPVGTQPDGTGARERNCSAVSRLVATFGGGCGPLSVSRPARLIAERVVAVDGGSAGRAGLRASRRARRIGAG